MTVAQFVQKFKEMYAAARAGDIATASLILWELVGAVLIANPTSFMSATRGVRASVFDTMSEEMLLIELEKVCNAPSAVGAVDDKLEGAFIDLVRPILLALLKKWLGL